MVQDDWSLGSETLQGLSTLTLLRSSDYVGSAGRMLPCYYPKVCPWSGEITLGEDRAERDGGEGRRNYPRRGIGKITLGEGSEITLERDRRKLPSERDRGRSEITLGEGSGELPSERDREITRARAGSTLGEGLGRARAFGKYPR